MPRGTYVRGLGTEVSRISGLRGLEKMPSLVKVAVSRFVCSVSTTSRYICIYER